MNTSLKKILRNIANLSLMVILGGSVAGAQTTLPSQVAVFMPQEIVNNLVLESEVNRLAKSGDWGQKKTPTQKKHWTAYSDREKNTTYKQPNQSSGAFDQLKFNEKVRIADIKNGFALVYTEPKEGEPYPNISGTAKSRGWIPMENLLLWQSCPANDRGIYQKALLVANLDNAGQSNADLGVRYSNPQSKSQIGNIKTDMTFYFVMKKDPKTGLVLLAKQAKMDGASDQMLYGWVNKNSFTPWNQRSCLEPTWDVNDVDFLKSKSNNLYHFYSDASLSTPVSAYSYGNVYSPDKSPASHYRMDPYKTRFPILDNETKKTNIYKCTSFGNNGKDVRIVDVTKPQDTEAKKKLEKLTNQSENINLIFVIDGTTSMKPYFASLKKAIKESINYFDKQKFNVKASVVIYRDYADGDALVEVQPLVKTTDAQLSKFLDEVGKLKYGANSSPNDHTHTEALYKGIETALDANKIGYSSDHSNMMLVIGDCGNALNDSKALTESQLIKKLVDNNINLMSYQVRNNSSEAWQLFNSQMSNLIRQNMEEQYKKRKITAKVKFKPNKLGYDIDNGNGSQLFVGSTRFGDEGKDMDPNVLSRLITDNIGNFKDAIQKQIDVLQGALGGNFDGFDEGGSVTSNTMDLQFLKSKLGEDLAKKLLEKNVTMATTSYVPKTYPGTERQLWKPIVFLSSAELADLLDRLAPVYNQANAVKESNNRKPYIDAVKGLLKAMIPDITDAEMDQKGIAEVMNMISGLNVTSDALNYSLIDLQDIHKVPHDKFISLVNDFCDKYERVRNIKQRQYTYAYENNNTKYYWIPVEDLP